MRSKVLLYRLGAETEKGAALRALLGEAKLPALTVEGLARHLSR